MAIQSCLFESSFVVLEDSLLEVAFPETLRANGVSHGTSSKPSLISIQGPKHSIDTTSIKKLLLSCWNGDLEDVKREAPQTLSMLEAHGIAMNIFGTMQCIACMRKNLSLLQYCLTLNYNASELISEAYQTRNSIWKATTDAPVLETWRLLIKNGLLGQQAGGMRRRILKSLAVTGISADLPGVELLQDLSRHGLVISDKLLNVAARKTDPDTMRYLISKCSLQDLERSNALLMAAAFNTPLIELLLETGMNVNTELVAEFTDPWSYNPGTTPLQSAAERGDMDAVKLLLARGPSQTIRNDHLKTAADMAEEEGHQEVADFIRKSEWKI